MKIEDIADELIDEILKLEFAKEFDEDKVGKDEYYFSEHSKNLDIIYQFPFEMKWIKQRDSWAKKVLWQLIQDRFGDYCNDLKLDDDLLEAWFFGYEGYRGYPIYLDKNRFIDELTKELQKAYRKRIKENYNCSKCDAMISERFPHGHKNHLHRIGPAKKPQPNPDDDWDSHNWNHILLCGECYRRKY